LDKRETNTTGARVEVLVGETGKFRFNVHAKNGAIVLSSEHYTTESAAFNGAFAVQAEGQSAANYSLKENASGGFYFTLSAQNGQIIGVSQQYTTRASATSAISSLQSFLPTVVVL
ncbi:MAG: YegP family protein, partial [Acidobacteria bacterium]|nr:YegP family protein [Acidobacteriota bacterium]